MVKNTFGIAMSVRCRSPSEKLNIITIKAIYTKHYFLIFKYLLPYGNNFNNKY
jgi:hypothetical protein